ncbi:superoxide dismutase [Ruficoccus amylovorans]|uniref:Superoxide dismutase n=2 Tax=Ruficoccus amylovorans TaxID=1804625 RepID=A0A842HG97_9BACT|nr:superoxide dismutase [Ruficoccus amylovorans]
MNSAGEYELPPLPYAYDALEPAIDAETMRLHHDIHFNGYKNGLNKALAQLKQFRSAGDYPEISYWENELAFNGAGYNLHTVFFANMAPEGTTKPSSTLSKTLDTHFGGLDAFKGQFSAAAAKVQGSGWAILGYQPFGGKLVVLQAEKHQNLTQWGVIPILALDVWEHAYYLKYQNRRGDYIKNWWNVVNWDNVAQRTEAAMTA